MSDQAQPEQQVNVNNLIEKLKARISQDAVEIALLQCEVDTLRQLLDDTNKGSNAS